MKRILVRAPQWLGDAVVSTVFLHRVKAQNPDSSISVLTVPALAAIFESHPAVNSVLTLPFPKKSVSQTARMIREGNFDTTYILPRSLRTALEAWLGKVPQRAGFGGDLRQLFFTSAVPYDDQLVYPHRMLKLIGEESYPLESVKPFFPSKKPEASKLKELCGGSFEELKRPLLGLAPMSIASARTWDADRFATVAERFIKQQGGTVVLFGSPQEKSALHTLRQKISVPVINTAGQLDLPELGWFMSQLNFLLANDSGLMHVASCFNVPTIVIFGASDPRFALPIWGRFFPVQNTNIPCVPCGRNVCVRFGPYHRECLTSVTSTYVEETLQEISSK